MTCVEAARDGNLAVLMYLRTKGCPWDAETCHAAAEGGHLQVLLWAALRGCPWN